MSRKHPDPEPEPDPFLSSREERRINWWKWLDDNGHEPEDAPPDDPQPPIEPPPLPRRKSEAPKAPPVTPGSPPPLKLSPEARRWLVIGLPTIAGLLLLWAWLVSGLS